MNTRTEFIQNSSRKKIICYGAGRYLKSVRNYIYSEGFEITYLVDSNKDIWGKTQCEIKISSPEILKTCSGEEYFIFISSKYYAAEIKKQIEADYPNKFTILCWPLAIDSFREFDDGMWEERIGRVCDYFYTRASEGVSEDKKKEYLDEKRKLLEDKQKVILPRTPLMITTRCTLRCKECANLMPYYEKPKDYSADEIISWIKNVCDAVDEWICLELVGGEPFMYKDFERILTYALAQEKIQTVEVATNGTLIPSENIMQLLKNKKVIVKISEYPNIVDYNRIIDRLKENGIRHELVYAMKWSRTGSLTHRGRSMLEVHTQYLNCGNAKMCRTILNGKLYVCSKAASLMEIGAATDIEFIDLKTRENLRERIRDFLRLTYSEACNYCDLGTSAEELIEPAVQVEKYKNAR